MTNDANDRHDHSPEPRTGPGTDDNTISPLPGEPGIPDVATRRPIAMSKKGLLAVALLLGSLVAVSAYTLQSFSASGKKADDTDAKLMRDKPMAATTELRRLDMPPAPVAVATAPRIPALAPTAEELVEPIGVRRTGSAAPGGPKTVAPEDAPVMLVTTRPGAQQASGASARSADAPVPLNESTISREPTDATDPISATTRNLQGYQHQLQQLLENLTRTSSAATGQTAAPMTSGAMLGGPQSGATAPVVGPASTGGLFSGQLQGSVTPKVVASKLGDRSLTLPKGTAFTCALKTRVISAASGLVGCQVQRNVFSDDGRVLLIERGSHLDGEYRVASVRPGTVRIPVLWTRIRTPLGVTVDVDSPGTGQLGDSGIDGYVDNRWGERLGAALLLSLIDDSVKLVLQNHANQPDNSGQANTIVLPSTTANSSKLAEKVLDSTINIPPLIYQNQGGIVGIYVARDVDFSSVYELRPSTVQAASESAR